MECNTLNEVFALPSEEETHDLGALYPGDGYTCHVPEIEWLTRGLHGVTSARVLIKTHQCIYQDHRRFWALRSVWFDGKPIMLLQNAGREGDDHRKRYITDLAAYLEMVNHIHSLVEVQLEQETFESNVTDPNKPEPNLTKFYHGYYGMTEW